MIKRHTTKARDGETCAYCGKPFRQGERVHQALTDYDRPEDRGELTCWNSATCDRRHRRDVLLGRQEVVFGTLNGEPWELVKPAGKSCVYYRGAGGGPGFFPGPYSAKGALETIFYPVWQALGLSWTIDGWIAGDTVIV